MQGREEIILNPKERIEEGGEDAMNWNRAALGVAITSHPYLLNTVTQLLSNTFASKQYQEQSTCSLS